MEVNEKLDVFLEKIAKNYFDLEMILDCRLGTTIVTVEELINLAVGDVIELEKLSGDGADIYANERIIARAEIMIFENNFAVRVNEATTYTTAFKYFQDEDPIGG
jgi:flagellar motor switch protein FliN/FliY